MDTNNLVMTKIVHSPDDGGYWIDQWSSDTEMSRASTKIYRSLFEARSALKNGRVKWEEWS